MARRSRSMPPRPPADFGGIDRYHGGPFALGSRSLKLRWMRVFDRQGRATNLLADRTAPTHRPVRSLCREHGIEHRLTKPYNPWTNGQTERMNRAIKDATVKAFHYENLESIKAHVQDPSRPRPALRGPKLPARPRVAPYGKRLFQRAEARVRCSER